MRARRRSLGSQAGFSLVAAAASITVMLLLMGMAVPTWRYVMQNAREEELIFRGTQIVEAIERYQRKHNNTAPVSLDVLVKGKFLRKAYKDPMTPEGQWRFVRPGEGLVMPPSAAGQARPGMPTPAPARAPGAGRRSGPGAQPGGLGAIIGVASTSQEKSLRVFNGRTRYDQWLFVVGQPRVIGKDATMRVVPRLPRNPRDNPRPQR